MQNAHCQVFPVFWQSLRSIKFYPVMCSSTEDMALLNAKLSSRGDIRKKFSTATWASALRKLEKDGQVSSGLVVRWNNTAIASEKLTGNKAMALNHMLKYPAEALDGILDMASDYGWPRCPVNEEGLCSKKIIEGYAPKTGSKAWQTRRVVSKQSIVLMVANLTAQWKRKPNQMRLPLPRALLEDASVASAVVTNIAKEFLESHPVAADVVQKEFVQLWLDGDSNIDVDIKGALGELSANFKPLDIQALKRIADNLSNKPLPGTILSMAHSIKVEGAMLEQKALDLFLDKARYDVKTFLLWQSKVCSYQCVKSTLMFRYI